MMEAKNIMEYYKQLIQQQTSLFPCKGKTINITCEHGVYIVFNPQDEVLHVGKTNRGEGGLCKRLQNHLTGTSSFRDNYLKKKGINLRDGYYYKYLPIESSRSRTLAEALTAGLLCPIYIGTGEKRID